MLDLGGQTQGLGWVGRTNARFQRLRRRQARPRRVALGFKGKEQGLGQIALGFRRDLGLKGISLGFQEEIGQARKGALGFKREEQAQKRIVLGFEEGGVRAKMKQGTRRKIEKNQKRIYKIMYKSDHTWKETKNPNSQMHKPSSNQTQTKLKPNKLQRNLQTLLLSCQNAKTRRRIERETKRMKRNEEESYLQRARGIRVLVRNKIIKKRNNKIMKKGSQLKKKGAER